MSFLYPDFSYVIFALSVNIEIKFMQSFNNMSHLKHWLINFFRIKSYTHMRTHARARADLKIILFRLSK